MVSKRPRNIGIFDLMRYYFPITAIASILHRISGFLLFLLIPYLLCIFDQSMASEVQFNALATDSPICVGFVWIALSALWYHLLAGVKHLCMDMGFFETIQGGKWASITVLILGVAGAAALGVWLW